jgi:hypothetical protein
LLEIHQGFGEHSILPENYLIKHCFAGVHMEIGAPYHYCLMVAIFSKKGKAEIEEGRTKLGGELERKRNEN